MIKNDKSGFYWNKKENSFMTGDSTAGIDHENIIIYGDDNQDTKNIKKLIVFGDY